MNSSKILAMILAMIIAFSAVTPVASETYALQDAEADSVSGNWYDDLLPEGVCSATEAEHTYDAGSVCSSCQVVTAIMNGAEYSELSEALMAANPDSLIVLQRNTKVEALDLYTTLDLNGNHLVATGIVDAANADAHIVDNGGGGSITTSDIRLYKDNGQLAIDAENNNVYTFETVALKQKVEKLDTDRASVKFYIDKVSTDTKLDDSILSGTNVKVRLTVEWSEEGVSKSHSFVYKQELVDAYVSGWDNKIFTCTISGLEELGDYTITANVISCNVVTSAEEVQKLLTWKEYLALSSAEQRAYKESFENRDDYYKWLKEAREAYDAEQETEMDGSIDIGGILKP